MNKIRSRPTSLIFVNPKDSGLDTLLNPKQSQVEELYSPTSDDESFEFYRWHLDYQNLCISQMEWNNPHSPSSQTFPENVKDGKVETSELLSFLYNNDSKLPHSSNSIWDLHDTFEKQLKKNRLNKRAWDRLVEEIEKGNGHPFVDQMKLRDEILPWERQIHEMNLAKKKFFIRRFMEIEGTECDKPWETLIMEAKSYKAVGHLLNQAQLDLLRDEIMPWEKQIVEMQSKEFENPKDDSCPWNQLIGQVSKSLEKRGKKLQQEDIDKLKDEIVPWEKQISNGIYVDSFSPTSDKFTSNPTTPKSTSFNSKTLECESVSSEKISIKECKNSIDIDTIRRDSKSSSRFDSQPNTRRLSRQYQNLTCDEIDLTSPIKEPKTESFEKLKVESPAYQSVWKRASTILLSKKRLSFFDKVKPRSTQSKPRCKSESFISNEQIISALETHIFPMADKELNVPEKLKEQVLQNIKENKLDADKYMDFVSQVYLALKWQSLPSYSFYESKWSRVTCTRILLRLFTLGLDK
jgi:hypothetical protein